MQYIEAIVKIQTVYPDFVPKRNIYLSFVPDEGRILLVVMNSYIFL
jgi:hypothetical protein